MITLSSSIPPYVVQDATERRDDLISDLRALTGTHAKCPEASAAFHRPSILRRIAAALAPLVPAGIDRLAARSGTDAVLATALSLQTGIPFALVDIAEGIVGEIHPSERAVLLAYQQDVDHDILLEKLASAGVRPKLALSVLGTDAFDVGQVLTWQTLFSFAELSNSNKESPHD